MSAEKGAADSVSDFNESDYHQTDFCKIQPDRVSRHLAT